MMLIVCCDVSAVNSFHSLSIWPLLFIPSSFSFLPRFLFFHLFSFVTLTSFPSLLFFGVLDLFRFHSLRGSRAHAARCIVTTSLTTRPAHHRPRSFSHLLFCIHPPFCLSSHISFSSVLLLSAFPFLSLSQRLTCS